MARGGDTRKGILLLLTNAMLRYVPSEKHLAFPVPMGGGRNEKSQLACTGMHPRTSVKRVKSMKTTRKTALLSVRR